MATRLDVISAAIDRRVAGWTQAPEGDRRQLLITFLVVTLILFLRRPFAFLDPQFWAEDGLFFVDQYQHGLTSWWLPYAGYLSLATRVLAWVAGLGPVWAAPILFSLLAWLTTLAVIWRLMDRRVPLPHKPLMAAAMVLVPHTSAEVFVNLINVQWIMAPLLWIAVIQERPNPGRGYLAQATLDCAVVLLVTLTGPYGLLACPLLVARLIRARDRYSAALLLANVAGVIVQLRFLVQSFSGDSALSVYPVWSVWLNMLARRFVAHLLVPGEWFADMLHVQVVLIAAAVLLVQVAVLFCAKGQRWHAATLMCFAWLVVISVAFKFRDQPALLTKTGNGARYSFLPLAFAAWTLCMGLHGTCPPLLRRAAALLLMLMVFNTSYSGLLYMNHHEDHWRRESARIGVEPNVRIAINPAGWFVELNQEGAGGR